MLRDLDGKIFYSGSLNDKIFTLSEDRKTSLLFKNLEG
jgi:hypothetical protein